MDTDDNGQGELGFGDNGNKKRAVAVEQVRVLMDKMPPFVRDSQTSKMAASFVRTEAPNMRVAVLAFIRLMGEQGATDEEIETALGYKHQTASARRNELMNMGLIRPCGERPTESGCRATVWVHHRLELPR